MCKNADGSEEEAGDQPAWVRGLATAAATQDASNITFNRLMMATKPDSDLFCAVELRIVKNEKYSTQTRVLGHSDCFCVVFKVEFIALAASQVPYPAVVACPVRTTDFHTHIHLILMTTTITSHSSQLNNN